MLSSLVISFDDDLFDPRSVRIGDEDAPFGGVAERRDLRDVLEGVRYGVS